MFGRMTGLFSTEPIFAPASRTLAPLYIPLAFAIFDANPVAAMNTLSKAPEVDHHQPNGEQTDGHEDADPQL